MGFLGESAWIDSPCLIGKGRGETCMPRVCHLCHGGHSPSLDEEWPFPDLQALLAQGCWPELHDGQGFGLGIASLRLVSDSSATWSSGAF